ncbi:MAG: hypothetical protein JXR90_02165 [Spirochaetes bacterium]|nr:hypothetical protein [Spirochaetota bacterium]
MKIFKTEVIYKIEIAMLLIMVSCNNLNDYDTLNNLPQFNPIVADNSLLKDLGYGFTIAFADSEEFKDFKMYFDISLYKDDKIVFVDSDYEFEINNNYPSIRKIGDNYEILLLVNDRPSINKLLMLIVNKDKSISKEIIPYFQMLPKDIDLDGKLELVGIVSDYEMQGEDNIMPYVPILVYEYTDRGILLDAIETKKANIRVYDSFYGFDYSEKYEFKGDIKFKNELNRHQ